MPQRLQSVKAHLRSSPKRYDENSKVHAELRTANALDRAFPVLERELSRLVEDAVAAEVLH